jgi:DNA-binding LytR/AlgR family response regulator
MPRREVNLMKVEVKVDEQCEETTVTIVTKSMTAEVNELVSRLQSQYPDLLVGFHEGNAHVVKTDDIIRVYASKQKVFIVTAEREYLARLRLYQLEERLPTSGFVRISNSEIVNLRKVRDFDLSFSGSICVRFVDGSTTYVSRRYVARIKTVLGM